MMASLFGALAPLAEIADGEAFAALAERRFGRERIVFHDDKPRRIAAVELGDCAVTLVDAGEHVVDSQPADRRSFDPDGLKLLVPLSGSVHLVGDGDVALLSPGSSCFYDPARA